jgi:hypothetical protein
LPPVDKFIVGSFIDLKALDVENWPSLSMLEN